MKLDSNYNFGIPEEHWVEPDHQIILVTSMLRGALSSESSPWAAQLHNASGFRGWEEPHFLWPTPPDPRWLLHWCSHCSDLSSLPLMWPLRGAIKDQRASPQTRCFTWQVVGAARDWNIHSRWKTDGPVNNIQRVQLPHKPRICPGRRHKRYGSNSKNSSTLQADGWSERCERCLSKTAAKLSKD